MVLDANGTFGYIEAKDTLKTGGDLFSACHTPTVRRSIL